MRINLHKFTKVNLLAIFIIAGLILLHLFLLSKTFLIDSNGNMRAAVAGYGDIPFHMTQVSKFAYEQNLNFNEPIFDGERLRYAFLINLISGLLLRITGNWTFAMQAPVLLLMASGIWLMFLSYRNFLKSVLGASVAVIIFLFGSGFGGYFVVRDQLIAAHRTPSTFTQYLVENSVSTTIKWDAKYPNQNLVWGAPMSLVFLHQRSFILGFFCFTLFWYVFNKWKHQQKNVFLIIVIGTIVGLTPLSHYHSFVAMVVVVLIYSVWAVAKNDLRFAKRLILICMIAAILAIPQIIYLVQGKNGLALGDQPFMKFRLGWMSEPTIGSVQFDPAQGLFIGHVLPFINFLWINFGVILPMFLVITTIVMTSRKLRESFPSIATLTEIAISLFIIAQLIRFQPWDFDNNKIFVYFQFFVAPVIVAFFIWVYKKTKILGLITLLLFTLTVTFSGILDQIPRLLVQKEQMPVIFSVDAIKTANFVRNNIDDQERIVTTSTHLNPVNSLAGRPALVGYPGWLWTRGINYGDREANLRNFYENPNSLRNLLMLYRARYILVDPNAIYDWKANTAEFDKHFRLLFRQGQYSLYQLP